MCIFFNIDKLETLHTHKEREGDRQDRLADGERERKLFYSFEL